MPLLSRPWALHDCRDVEALLNRAVARSRFAVDLEPAERDDLLCDLFRVAWQLAQKFDPDRGSFSTFLYSSAQRRAIDFYRRERGRTVWRFANGVVHERPRPVFEPLDAGRLDRAFGTGSGNHAADRDPALDRLLRGGSGTLVGDYEELGLAPPRRAA